MSDRPVRETNRPMFPAGLPETGVTTVRLVAHDSALNRRLGWRLAELGMNVTAHKFAEIDTRPATTDLPLDDADFVIVDLGSGDVQVEAALNVLFRVVHCPSDSGPAPRVVVLAPWFDAASRPAWAELGVWLVADRTTPPPEIVAAIHIQLAAKLAGNLVSRPRRP